MSGRLLMVLGVMGLAAGPAAAATRVGVVQASITIVESCRTEVSTRQGAAKAQTQCRYGQPVKVERVSTQAPGKVSPDRLVITY
jgi:hypothetical protein